MSGRTVPPLAVPEAIDQAFLPSIEALRALHGPGAAADPERIHRARTAVRRLRSNIRVLDTHTEPVPSLRDELEWLGDGLGTVRDADVLMGRVRHEVDDLPGRLLPGTTTLLAAIGSERRAADRRVHADVGSARFRHLLDELDLFLKEASASTGTIEARAVVRPRWRALRTAVRDLPEPPTDEQLHDLRIETKRARYAAEIFVRVSGARGRRFVRRATRLQDLLGAQHDAVRAHAWFLGFEGDDPSAAAASGWLAARAAADRDALRRSWRPAWESLGEPKARFW
jgi:CHAD domain-containing protein